jgi:signal transduction histidine kinase
MVSVVDGRRDDAAESARLAEEQAALRRVATLVAARAPEDDVVAAISAEVGKLFDADTANTMRWDGEALRVVGDWYRDGRTGRAGDVFPFGGDTISARIIASSAPGRIDGLDDLRTEFGRLRFDELGIAAAIGAPVVVDGSVWGVVTAARFHDREPFPPRAEHHLHDFATLFALAIENGEWRRSLAGMLEEQSGLRRVATLVAGGRSRNEVLGEVVRQAGAVFAAHAVEVVRWEGVQDEVVVVRAWTAGATSPARPGTVLRPGAGSAVIALLETGVAARTTDGERSSIAAPMIIDGLLEGALVAHRPASEPFSPGAENRLRGFSDLAAQSVANDRAQEDLRRSRERIVREGDAARQRLERNLHDGAQQRLVSVSISLRVALRHLGEEAGKARELLESAAEELGYALEELRDLARGLHPAILTDRGLGPALEVLANRSNLPVTLASDIPSELPPSTAAAAYYVVAESLTNAAKYAEATRVTVSVRSTGTGIRVEVADDGVGGAAVSEGSGLLNLSDRVAALGGRLTITSPPGGGTTVAATIPCGAA